MLASWAVRVKGLDFLELMIWGLGLRATAMKVEQITVHV